MGRLEDPRTLSLFIECLTESANGVDGYVRWKPRPWQWVQSNLPGETQRTIADHLRIYIQKGGKVTKAKETYYDSDYHYDFRPRIGSQDCYFEIVVKPSATGDYLYVVSAHPK